MAITSSWRKTCNHGVKPGNIVGAIANEAGLDTKHLRRAPLTGHGPR